MSDDASRYGSKAADMPWVVRHPVVSVSLAVLIMSSALLVLWNEQANPLVIGLSVFGALILVAAFSAGVNYLGGLADGRFAEQYERARSSQAES